MNEIILSAKNINKSFCQPDEFHVLDNVNLDVNKGEFVTIMGKSGCGKSTLLYILSTLDTKYEGDIEIKDENVSGWSENRLARFRNRHIGFVFQFHFLLPEFTVLQNVMMPGLKLGRFDSMKIHADAMKCLEQLNVQSCAHKLASKLSGGQQQRVAIARALINNPAIILADEPTGNLDSANSANVLEIFVDLAKHGNTIITVTHDHDFAKRSDRIVEMSDGKLVTGRVN
jgi:lipoprotein-releasing system ATP-binding protein